MITYDTKLFEQQQWQRKSQVSGHKKRDRAHLVHSPHLLLTGSVQGWSLLALLHGLLGKGSMQTWKKKAFKGARKNNRCKDPANSNDFNITDYGILDDSWWFLVVLAIPSCCCTFSTARSVTNAALQAATRTGPLRSCFDFPANEALSENPAAAGYQWIPCTSLKVKVSYNSELPMASPWCHLVIGCQRKTYAKLEVLLALICKAMFWSAHIGAVRSLVLFAWLVNVLPDSRSVCYLARWGRKHAKTIRERVRTNLSHTWFEQKSLGWILWPNVASS